MQVLGWKGRKVGTAAGADLDGGIGGDTLHASTCLAAVMRHRRWAASEAGDEASHSRLDVDSDPRSSGKTRWSIIFYIRWVSVLENESVSEWVSEKYNDMK